MNKLIFINRYSCLDGKGIIYGNCTFDVLFPGETKPMPLGFVQLKAFEVLIVQMFLLDDDHLSKFGWDAKYREQFWCEVSLARLGANACNGEGNFLNSPASQAIVEKSVGLMRSYPNYDQIYDDLIKEQISAQKPSFWMQFAIFRFIRNLFRFR